MSAIQRVFEQAIKKGQDKQVKHLDKLTELMETIIDNENEQIVLMKKICDKLGIKTEVEE